MRDLLRKLTRGGLVSFTAVLIFLLAMAVAELRRIYPERSALRAAMDLTVFVDVYDENGWPIASGTGVILGSDEVVTCLHVIEGGRYVTITTQSGRTVDVLGVRDTSEVLDLAILDARLPVSAGATTERPAIGTSVFSLGYSRYAAGGEPDLCYGTITKRAEVDFFTHDAEIASGFSGGGTWNEAGQLVGINVMSQNDGPTRSLAAPAQAVTELRARGRETLVYDYPPRAEWPELWWPDRAYRILRHEGLGAVADSLIARLHVPRNVDFLMSLVREDFLDPAPHAALFLYHMSDVDLGALTRESAILDSLETDAIAGVYPLIMALTPAIHGEYELALEYLADDRVCADRFLDLFTYARGLVAVYAGKFGVATKAYERLEWMGSPLAEALVAEVYPELEVASAAAAESNAVSSTDGDGGSR